MVASRRQANLEGPGSPGPLFGQYRCLNCRPRFFAAVSGQFDRARDAQREPIEIHLEGVFGRGNDNSRLFGRIPTAMSIVKARPAQWGVQILEILAKHGHLNAFQELAARGRSRRRSKNTLEWRQPRVE